MDMDTGMSTEGLCASDDLRQERALNARIHGGSDSVECVSEEHRLDFAQTNTWIVNSKLPDSLAKTIEHQKNKNQFPNRVDPYPSAVPWFSEEDRNRLSNKALLAISAAPRDSNTGVHGRANQLKKIRVPGMRNMTINRDLWQVKASYTRMASLKRNAFTPLLLVATMMTISDKLSAWKCLRYVGI
ncbi:hypothetical protein FG05_35018 [Fusarium graminearum]|nr:hypothetical protein FG05_35018 [Fusarium graminearum]